jgi:hypothetical protein
MCVGDVRRSERHNRNPGSTRIMWIVFVALITSRPTEAVAIRVKYRRDSTARLTKSTTTTDTTTAIAATNQKIDLSFMVLHRNTIIQLTVHRANPRCNSFGRWSVPAPLSPARRRTSPPPSRPPPWPCSDGRARPGQRQTAAPTRSGNAGVAIRWSALIGHGGPYVANRALLPRCQTSRAWL